MKLHKRIYDSMLAEHLGNERQMAFISGPRQVGKTTTCRNQSDLYLNWDNVDDRETILAGPARIISEFNLEYLRSRPHIALFDELHKFSRWKSFLKGLFDTHSEKVRILVTGSSRLDTYSRGGDSLMGRYFLYRMHPFSVAETIRADLPGPSQILRSPSPVAIEEFNALWEFGGYPEPFLKRDKRFFLRWQKLRGRQFLREDVRDLTQIQNIDQLELLVTLLGARSGEQLIFSNLAKTLRVSVDTVRRWINILCSMHLGFLLRPWFKNVSRSLRKEPKWYLRDWAGIEDSGQKSETFIACHLLKAVDGWNDLGLGEFSLGYLRDTSSREVDFLVSRDGKPWFLVEAKHKEPFISKSLHYFQRQLNVPYAFQVVLNEDYIDKDCFQIPGKPLVVPAKTLLSQLI